MSETSAYQLPSSWTLATLGDVVAIIRGVTYSKSDAQSTPAPGLVPILRATNIGQSLTFDDLVYVPQHYVKTDQLLRPGDIVVAASSGSRHVVGKAAPLTRDWKGSFGAFCFALRPTHELNHAYLAFFLMTDDYRKRISRLSAGVNINNIKAEHIAGTPIPIPPRQEQDRIVEELERQFTRLDAAIEDLRHAQASLKNYRASVLKAACEGRLVPTEAELDRREGGALPAGWTWTNLSELAWNSGYGTSQKCDYQASGPPVLRIPNIYKNRIDTTDLKRAIHTSTIGLEPLEPGDFIIIRTNGSRDLIGRGALITQRFHEPTYFASYLIRFRLIPDKAIQKWIALIWDSPYLRTNLEKLAATSAGQYNVSLRALSSIRIPLPPAAEINEVAAEIERRLSLLDTTESAIEAGLRKSSNLRDSLLRRAFEGTLVSQDPTDEPASALLKKIQEKRNSTKDEKKSRSWRDNSRRPNEPKSGLDNQESDSILHPVIEAQPIAPPAVATEPTSRTQPFAERNSLEQVELVWNTLFGRGLLSKEDAIPEIAQGLREKGLAHFQRLRQGGPLFNEIAGTLDRGVRQGFFDRPKRGYIRAILPDPKAYSLDHWRLCLLGALDGEPVEEEDALRAAAEWARENMGLEFVRLREDGVILQGLRAALKEAAKRGEITRKRGKVFRSPTAKGRIDPA